jgi:ankyrin repeat protein
MTALHYAAREGHRDALLALVEANFDLIHRNGDGESALDLLVKHEHRAAIADLLRFHWNRGERSMIIEILYAP